MTMQGRQVCELEQTSHDMAEPQDASASTGLRQASVCRLRLK